MATQAERRAQTRGRILEAARRCFAAQGYDGTSTDEILKEAAVSRGALYHHFATKQEVFEAVFVAESDAAIARSLKRAAASASPLEVLILTGLAWLQEVRRPEVGTIVIELGPQVLGWTRARDLEARTSLGLMTRGLERAIAAGELDVPSVPLAARFINAALAEAALAFRSDPKTPRRVIEASVRQLIEGLAGVAGRG